MDLKDKNYSDLPCEDPASDILSLLQIHKKTNIHQSVKVGKMFTFSHKDNVNHCLHLCEIVYMR